MPIYEFECRSCGHVWDRLQKLSDPDPEACPTCAAGEVGRRVTAAAFRLKGGGWYETDFKSDKDKKRNLVEGGETRSDAAAASGTSTSESSGNAAPAPAAAPAAAAPAPAPAPARGDS